MSNELVDRRKFRSNATTAMLEMNTSLFRAKFAFVTN